MNDTLKYRYLVAVSLYNGTARTVCELPHYVDLLIGDTVLIGEDEQPGECISAVCLVDESTYDMICSALEKYDDFEMLVGKQTIITERFLLSGKEADS